MPLNSGTMAGWAVGVTGIEGNNCSLRPPGDDFEKANTAAAEPNIAGHNNDSHKVNHSEICYPHAQPENSTPLP